MRIMKRIFASILTIVIALGDCSGMTALAAETSVSENTILENTVLENTVSENTVSENDIPVAETSQTINLPALHIGQISNGETLPTAEDNT